MTVSNGGGQEMQAITSQEVQATIKEMMTEEELHALEVRMTIKKALMMIPYMEESNYKKFTVERQFEAEYMRLLSSVLESKLGDDAPFEWELAAIVAKGLANTRAAVLEKVLDKPKEITMSSLIGEQFSYEDYIDSQFVKRY